MAEHSHLPLPLRRCLLGGPDRVSSGSFSYGYPFLKQDALLETQKWEKGIFTHYIFFIVFGTCIADRHM